MKNAVLIHGMPSKDEYFDPDELDRPKEPISFFGYLAHGYSAYSDVISDLEGKVEEAVGKAAMKVKKSHEQSVSMKVGFPEKSHARPSPHVGGYDFSEAF